MRIVAYFFLGILILILQTSLLTSLPPWVGCPDLFFILIIYVSLRLKFVHGIVLLLLFGLIMDIFSGIYLGIYPITYLLLFFLLHGLSRRLAIQDMAHRIALVIVCYLLTNGIVYTFASYMTPDNEWTWNWKGIMMGTFLLAIMTFPLFTLFENLEEFFVTKKAGLLFVRTKKGNRFKN